MPHPYSGDPASFPASITLMDDGSDVPSFANFNTGYNGLADRTAWLKALASSAPCANFLAPVTAVLDSGSVASHMVAACWQPVSQDWVAVFMEGVVDGTPRPYGIIRTSHSGLPWGTPATTGTTKAMLAACASAADTGAVFVSLHNATGTDIVRQDAVGGLTTTTQPFLGTLLAATIVYAPTGYLLFGIDTTGGGGTFVGHLASSTDGTGVWTDISTSLPAGWASGAHALEAVFSAGNGSALSSPRSALFAISILSSLFSQLLANDGAGGFVDITPAFVGLGLGSIYSIAWNATRKLWGISVFVGGFIGKFYTSPDAIAWTLQHTFTIYPPLALAAVGFTWFAQAGARMLCSPDNGASWTTASCAVGPGSLQVPRFVSSGNQLLIFNDTSHAFSLQAGFMTGGQY